ncbi:alginate lyase family protein [Candidatus Viridilinea mediisalina]|uniref:Uncharacterized protein n=1 Tax=Candidatus Viridilinea mediisalina TaxID=2024553 RepID=A0A2A6RGL4_9CHLR|nr:alginate lyase family protein [Candidatus Viridilinea mediisalina]PDW02029.1 hypothetical protein CJ255_16130 [Candidatus Viridilinea mediisalina]
MNSLLRYTNILIGFIKHHFFSLTNLSDEAISKYLVMNLSLSNIAEFVRDLEERRGIVNTGDDLLKNMNEVFPDVFLRIVNRADKVCDRQFDLLGVNINLSSRIEWCSDFATGYKWKKSYYRFLKPARYPGGCDIKVPWDLSEGHQWVWLAQAYVLTNDDRYVLEFKSQINNWLKENAFLYSVNWVSPMKVATRVSNWLIAFELMRKSYVLDDVFIKKSVSSFLQHGQFIFAHLEGGRQNPKTGNHYIANLVGLLYLGLLCPYIKDSKQWLDFAFDELWNELHKQTLFDGMHHEGSVSYHRLVAEMFLYSYVMCINNKLYPPAFVAEQIQKMLDVIKIVTKPNGAAPQLGDSDNGRLHRLATWSDPYREWIDYRYLLAIGAIVFHREDYAFAAADQWEEALWLFGSGALTWMTINRNSVISDSKKTSSNLNDIGLYVSRFDKNCLIVNAGRKRGLGKFGHNHNDRLSFELQIEDQDFIIDPGTFVYTRDFNLRNMFRSTCYHSTVVVNDQEQSFFDPKYCFKMPDDVNSSVHEWVVDKDFDFLDASHDGYLRLLNVIHRRQFYSSKSGCYWIVRDIVEGRGFHDFDIYFRLAPRLVVEKEMIVPGTYVISSDRGVRLLVIPLNVFCNNDPSYKHEVIDGWVSYSYGKREPASVIHYQWSCSVPNTWDFLLLPVFPTETTDHVWLKFKELAPKYLLNANYSWFK